MNISKAKAYFLTGTAGIAIAPMMGLALAPAANAADLKLKAPPPPPIAAPSWAGWYIGVSAGGASQSSDFTFGDPDEGFGGKGNGVGTNTGGSFIGGGHIGYNWQQGTFVYGLEADASGLSKPSGTYFPGITEPTATYGSHVSWMVTAHGRLGLTVGDGNTLLYGTAGVAFGRIKASADELVAFGAFNDYSSTRTGWVAGAGIERMIMPNVIIGLEGLFVDFGSFNATSSDAGKCCAGIHNKLAIGRARLSFKF
jgi:outer membrane immunogenic protein